MSFNVFEDDAIMAEFDRIAAEPIDNEPYSLVKNPVPVVESILDFNGHKIDTGSWCSGEGVDEDKKKVGKAKTASDPKLAKAAPAKTGEKKDDGKLVENVDAKEKKEKGQTTEVKTNTEVKAEKAPEAGKGGKFDSAAKSAASSNQSGAQKNKKFEENAKLQKHIDLFKKGVRALATDSKTAADAEKVLKKFDKISSYLKPRTESVDKTSKKQLTESTEEITVSVPKLNAAAKSFGVTDAEIAAHYDDASASYVDASGKPFVGPVDGFFSFIDPDGTSRVIPHTEDGIKKAGQYIAYRIKN